MANLDDKNKLDFTVLSCEQIDNQHTTITIQAYQNFKPKISVFPIKYQATVLAVNDELDYDSKWMN